MVLSKAAKLRSYFTIGSFDLQNYKFFGTTGTARGIRFINKKDQVKKPSLELYLIEFNSLSNILFR